MTAHTAHAPTVSVIMPAFNASPFIAEALDSALAQTFTDFEVLVVDDGSTDETAAIAERYVARDRRVLLNRQQNRGIATARNLAIARSRGRVLALLDSDDVWFPSYLAEQMAILDRRPDIDVLSANAVNLGGPADGKPLLPFAPGDLYDVSLLDLVRTESTVSIFATLRRGVVETVGPFDPAFRRSEDYDLWLRAIAAGLRLAVNPTPLARYRRRSDSLSADEAAMLDAMTRPLMKLRRHSQRHPDLVAAIDAQLARLTQRRLVAGAKTALERGDTAGLASYLSALAEATGTTTHRVAAWLSRRAPSTIRWALHCKQRYSQLGRTSRRAAAGASSPVTPHAVSRANSRA